MDRSNAVVAVFAALVANSAIVARPPKDAAEIAKLVELAYGMVDAIEDGAYDREDVIEDVIEDAAEPTDEPAGDEETAE